MASQLHVPYYDNIYAGYYVIVYYCRGCGASWQMLRVKFLLWNTFTYEKPRPWRDVLCVGLPAASTVRKKAWERTVRKEKTRHFTDWEIFISLPKYGCKKRWKNHLRLFGLFNNTERLLFNLICEREVWECISSQREKRRKKSKGCLKSQEGEWR